MLYSPCKDIYKDIKLLIKTAALCLQRGKIMARKIEVTDYRPEWETLFKEEAKKIKKILGKNCAGVYHIGSTSVKGLAAKPIIDIMPVVKDISLVDAHDKEFESLGYECRGEFGIPGRRFYAKGGDNRTHHIHIFELSNQTDIQRHIAVRDYLRSHQDTAAEYAALKKKLAAEFPFDNDGYCNGKEEYMKSLEKKALRWQAKQNRLSMGIALGMCFGAAFGVSFGTMYGNTGIGMCFGIAIGMMFGIVFGSADKTDNSRQE